MNNAVASRQHETGAEQVESSGVSGGELIADLQSTIERATTLVQELGGMLGEARTEVQSSGLSQRSSTLEARFVEAEEDIKELASRLVDSEHQVERLMNLYVATYQLHSTFEPVEVQTSISEIALNLLGAERFLLLMRSGQGMSCDVVRAEGFEGAPPRPFTTNLYEGGDSLVDATLEDGVLRLGPSEGSDVLAAVPLRVNQGTLGVLVVMKLLAHKPLLRPEDRDLLDLLSAHAAAALLAANLFSAKDRRLKSLESLVSLASGNAAKANS